MKLPASIAAAFEGHEDAVLVTVADIDRGLVDPTDIYLLVNDARVEIEHVIDEVDVKLFVAAVTGASLGLQTALVEGGVKVQTIANGNSAVDVHVTNPDEANCPSQLMLSPDELTVPAATRSEGRLTFPRLPEDYALDPLYREHRGTDMHFSLPAIDAWGLVTSSARVSFPACDVCGVTAEVRDVTGTVEKDGRMTSLCSFCSGLIDAGLVRPEGDGAGGTVYRQWHMGEWTPGDLIERPDVSSPTDDAPLEAPPASSTSEESA